MIKKNCLTLLILFSCCKQIKSEQKEIRNGNTESMVNSPFKKNTQTFYKPYLDTYWQGQLMTDTINNNKYWTKLFKKDSLNKTFKDAFINSLPLKDKTIIFLQDGLINQDYCKTITEPERAVFGYIALLNASYSHFDKSPKEECTISSALNLEDQYLEKHKYYLQYCFRNDAKILEETKYLSTYFSEAASVYFFFTEIILTVKGNKIHIFYSAEGSDRDIWDCIYTEKIDFLVETDNIKLINKKTLKEKYIYHYPNGSGILPP